MPLDEAPASAIRTPDQRLRVFISSTLAELAEERKAVARAITSLGLAPVMFELGARPHPPQELYRAYLAQSDIFVGLYWESYGWVGPGMDISGLEDEFRLSGGRPRLLYLKAPAPERQPELSSMIDEIRAQGTDAYRTFHSTRELGRLVRDDLALLLSERFVSSGPAVPAARPTASGASAAARTLPVTSTSLIGRDADIAAVVSLMARPDVRLVTVTGPGGMGKTRLAIAVGGALEAKAPPPVLFVPLATVSDSEDVLPRIAEAAGVILEGTRSAREALIDHFSGEPTVLLLDNLEQIVTVAPDIDEMLARCPGLTVLATSRIALRLRAEHEYVLAPLSSGSESWSGRPSDAWGSPAVRLFIDRAAAVGRTIDPSDDTTTAISEICRRLDGLPLAIELAAARTRLLDPAAVLARLESVLDTLGTGPVDLPERQRSLRATVEWSVSLLGDAEREFLATLSVFVDGWTLAAAAAAADVDEDSALDLLDTLAGHSLIRIEPRAETRFRMSTAVREYAAELLTGEERLEVERRHAGYFAALAEEQIPSERRAAQSERLRADDDNLRLAIRWFFDHDLERLPHLFRSLWLHWQIQDRMPEARSLSAELLRRLDPASLDAGTAAEMMFTVAVTATEVGDDATAFAALDAIRPRMGDVDDPAVRDELRLAEAWTLPSRGDMAGAVDAAEAAYAGFAARQDLLQAGAALTLGMLRMLQGDDEGARRYLTEVDLTAGRLQVQWLTAAGLTHLAIVEVRTGEPDAARARLRDLLERTDDTRAATLSACLILAAFGLLCAADGRMDTAATAIGAMDGLRARAGVRPWPNSRPIEDALRERVRAAVTPAEWDAAHTAGSALRMTEALGLVRSEMGAPAPG